MRMVSMISKGLAGVAALALVLTLSAGQATGGQGAGREAQIFFSSG